MKVRNLIILAIGVVTIASMSSCKSKESLYKKAYEKAQQQEQVVEPVINNETAVKVAPATPVAPVVSAPDPSDRRETLTVVSGDGLKAFSVVCGSFSLKTNAEGLQTTLKKDGYDAQIAVNPQTKMYRVIASTFDNRSLAVESRDGLRTKYPDAWLLYNK